MEQPYHLGLDIGTSSIGFSAINDDLSLKRVKGKQVYGVRLFTEGQTAEDRRFARANRRSQARKHRRLTLLNQIFAPHFTDKNFLNRLNQSRLVKADRDFTGAILFPETGDGAFKQQYPTMYHLRLAMLKNPYQKFDLRLIYLVVHDMLKHRGNFLNPAPVQSFAAKPFDLTATVTTLNSLYQSLFNWSFDLIPAKTKTLKSIEKTLTNTMLNVSQKKASLKTTLSVDKQSSDVKKILNALITALCGGKFKVKQLLNNQVDNESMTFDSEDVDDKLDAYEAVLDAEESQILKLMGYWYQQIILQQLLVKDQSLSASMVQIYDKHRKDLVLLRSFLDKYPDLRTAHRQYVSASGNSKKKLTNSEFSKQVAAILKNNHSKKAQMIQKSIELDDFMPKLRTNKNGVIPRQLNQLELEQILDAQKQFYPFLGTASTDMHLAKYQLSQLFAFKVPYYIGPLDEHSPFAWLVRNNVKPVEITPFNFNEQVNVMVTARQFIKRLTVNDSYLLNEPVLPAQSLLYEQFKVLNELNSIQVKQNDGRYQHLTTLQKDEVYHDVFQKYKTVSKKRFIEYISKYFIKQPDVTGLSDSTKFSNGLTSYIDMVKILGPNFDAQMAEQLIEWSTVFEDRKIFKAQIVQSGFNLTDVQIKQLLRLRYRGWGRLSKKLLTEVKNVNNESIMDVLWSTSKTLMSILADTKIADTIEKLNQKHLKQFTTDNAMVERVLADAYASPQNKKAIRQVIKVVDDIVTTIGYAPSTINLEFTRQSQLNGQQTISRLKQVQNLYQKLGKQIDATLHQELQQFDKLSDKQYFYFMQLGRDMYDGRQLNLSQMNDYDIDHIYPQSFVKDDSLDNRVLTKRTLNAQKGDGLAGDIAKPAAFKLWHQLFTLGLLSKKKKYHLNFKQQFLNPQQQVGFIQRQLVETSQVVKLSAQLLQSLYSTSEIVEVKAKLNTDIRQMYSFYKLRNLNDYHHAFDAYLTALNGTYLVNRYPKLKSMFVYGQHVYLNPRQFNFKQFNFLNGLDKHSHSTNAISKTYRNHLQTVGYQVWQYHCGLITRETETNRGAFWDMTNYSPDSNKTSLLPLKQDLATSKYGGYSGVKTAYLMVVKFAATDKVPAHYRLVAVPVNLASRLEQLFDKRTLQNQLVMQAAAKLFKSDLDTLFEIVIDKLELETLVGCDGYEFRTGGPKYRHIVNQLSLSVEAIQTLARPNMYDKKTLSKKLDDCFLEIVEKGQSKMGMVSFEKRMDKVADKFAIFEKLSNKQKLSTLDLLLQNLHANPAFPTLKTLKLASSQFLFATALKLPVGSYLKYQSPSGLHESIRYLN